MYIHFVDRHLGFLADVDVTRYRKGTIKTFDPENLGIAVGILLLCALELEICLGVKYPQLPANFAKKLLPGRGLYVIQCRKRHIELLLGDISIKFRIRV